MMCYKLELMYLKPDNSLCKEFDVYILNTLKENGSFGCEDQITGSEISSLLECHYTMD